MLICCGIAFWSDEIQGGFDSAASVLPVELRQSKLFLRKVNAVFLW